MANPNLISTTAIYSKTAFITPNTTATIIVANAANSNQVYKVSTIMVTNTFTSSININIDVLRSTTTWTICSNISVPPNSAVVLLNKEGVLYLEEGDTLRATASTGAYLKLYASYEIIS